MISKQVKIVIFAIISLFLIGFAVLVWTYQVGKADIAADIIPWPTKLTLKAKSVCIGQVDVSWTAPPVHEGKKLKEYVLKEIFTFPGESQGSFHQRRLYTGSNNYYSDTHRDLKNVNSRHRYQLTAYYGDYGSYSTLLTTKIIWIPAGLSSCSSPTPTPTSSSSPSPTPTSSSSPSPTTTPTTSPTPTASPTSSPTPTPTPTLTPTPTQSPTVSSTPTQSPGPTISPVLNDCNSICQELKFSSGNCTATCPTGSVNIGSILCTSGSCCCQGDSKYIPDAPTNLQAETIDKETIRLSWNKVDGVFGYTVNGVPKIITSQTSENRIIYEIKGLECETEYSYYVQSVNQMSLDDLVISLYSDPTNTIKATTLDCVNPIPSIKSEKVENIKLKANGQNSITISWNSTEGVTGYDIYDCSGKYLISTKNTSFTFDSLNCGTQYCFYVVAHDNAENNSQPSEQIKGDTEQCNIIIPNKSETHVSADTAVETSSAYKGLKGLKGGLISTGASLWFNLLVSILVITGVGLFMFKDEIFKK